MAASSEFQLTSTQTAIAVLVPAHLHQDVNALRSIHDKAYRKWQPHINLLYPFVEPARLSSALSILRESLRNERQFLVRCNEVADFKHRKNATVFLKPEKSSEDALQRLRTRLVESLGCNERDGTYDGEYRPHLTIGQAALTGGSIDRLTTKVQKLAGIEWELITLAVLQRDVSGEMKVIEELPLGGSEELGSGGKRSDTLEPGWSPCYQYTTEKGWTLHYSQSENNRGNDETSIGCTILTYNVMAEASAPPFSQRLPLLIEHISTAVSTTTTDMILCLQEVTEDLLPMVFEQKFIQERFPYATHSPSSVLPSHRNLVTISSAPFTHFTLQFPERHKSALLIRLRTFPLEVANIHLTSALTDEAVAIKKKQMLTLTNFLLNEHSTTGRDIVVAGDFNLTTSSRTIHTALLKNLIRPETAELVRDVINLNAWDDCFLVAGDQSADIFTDQEIFEGEEGATFDRCSNHLAAMLTPKANPVDNSPQRYDRILFMKNTHVEVEAFARFGLPSKDGVCASDHYGVCTTLRFRQDRSQNTVSAASSGKICDKIDLIEDSTDLRPFLGPYMPSLANQIMRTNALDTLRQTMAVHPHLKDIVLAPLGSYAMDTYVSDSDIDLLVIGSVTPKEFFDIALAQLRSLSLARGVGPEDAPAVHFVNSLVSIIACEVDGIQMDLQYCEAEELVKRYHAIKPTPNLQTLVFEPSVIAPLAPSSLRPLNTYRDAAYMLNTLPDLQSFRIAHRFLSRYLKRRGLYSAKYGYLGGIHLSLMLNRVVKLLHLKYFSLGDPGIGESIKLDTGDGKAKLTPATIVRSFLFYYSNFEFLKNAISDPVQDTPLSSTFQSGRYRQQPPIHIPALHLPTARPNIASSCTRLSAQTIQAEFALAAQHLDEGDWAWCHRSQEETVTEFLGEYGAYIRISVDVWDIDEIGGEKVRELVGTFESKIPSLMVALSKVEVRGVSIDARVWPSRFNCRNSERQQSNGTQLKGFYLAGVSARGQSINTDQKKLFTGKIIDAARTFDFNVQNAGILESGHIWVTTEVFPKKKILDMDLILDDRSWYRTHPQRNANAVDNSSDDENDAAEETLQPSLSAAVSSSRDRTRSPSKGLRPAQDIIARIRWDPEYNIEDFVVGYEDRFLGVKEIELVRWKSEQTDLEFIPMHRIVWIRRKDVDGDKVWDRNKKVDRLFGSGV